MWDTVHEAFHRPSSIINQRLTAAIWALIVVSLVPLVWDVLVGTEQPASLRAFDDFVLALFAVEYVLRVASFRPIEVEFYRHTPLGHIRAHITGRLRFMLNPMMLVDLVTILGSVPLLRGLRALRLLRLLRSKSILRYANPFEGMTRAIEENALLFGFGLSVFFSATVVGGLSFFLTERHLNPTITNLPDAMWWSIVTLTTVGYGDLTPVTGVGRVVAAALMLSGMVSLALFAGIVGSSLMSAVVTLREEQFRMSHFVDHILVCGYEPGTRMLLDTLAQELDLDQHDVVVFAPTERPADVPPTFRWLQGDPTKESELDKARVVHAGAVVVVGSRHELPQQADARTILTLFTIRRYLKRHVESERRENPMYIVAEILDAENVEHARTAGADEVIETTRVGFSMLAHALEVHGTATILGELADVNGHSLFVGPVPEELRGLPFEAVGQALKRKHNLMAIGLRGADGTDKLAPRDERICDAKTQILYLAKTPVLG